MGPKTGTYFARAKVGGKLIRQSLKTRTYSVAVLQFNGLLKANRGIAEVTDATRDGPMTFRAAAEAMLQQVFQPGRIPRSEGRAPGTAVRYLRR
jgi:hypothetical protein